MATIKVTIPLREYLTLLEDSRWLGYLEAAGVDNWSGYDCAAEMRKEEEGGANKD